MQKDQNPNLHLIADVGVIVSLILTIIIFNQQIQTQKTNELNEHISNIRSLKIELEKNIDLLDDLAKKNETLGKKLTFGELVLDNIKRSVSDGKISHHTIKSNLIAREFDAIEINGLIGFINSPDFSSEPNASLPKQNLANQLVKTIVEEYKPDFQETYNLIVLYELCLNKERNIEFCNNTTYIKIQR